VVGFEKLARSRARGSKELVVDVEQIAVVGSERRRKAGHTRLFEESGDSYARTCSDKGLIVRTFGGRITNR